MILRTSVRAVIYPENLDKQCSKAAHAVAVQAERDCRPYVPSKTGKLRTSGRVYGNTIVWNTPYAREMYFGHLYVDPVRKIAGFQTDAGWRSFRGRRKARSERKFKYKTGGDQWFTKAKRARLAGWVRLAQEVIERG